jgi:phosphotransferase system HPr-like phosphotransfer protein
VVILIIFESIILIIVSKYNKKREEISLRSKKINSKKELDKEKIFWIKELKINQNKNIEINIVPEGQDNYDVKLALKMGGAFAEKIKDNKYRIIIISKSSIANTTTLVHELLHIKLGHCDKEKTLNFKILNLLTLTSLRQLYEIEANKELCKYKNILEKRKITS